MTLTIFSLNLRHGLDALPPGFNRPYFWSVQLITAISVVIIIFVQANAPLVVPGNKKNKKYAYMYISCF